MITKLDSKTVNYINLKKGRKKHTHAHIIAH